MTKYNPANKAEVIEYMRALGVYVYMNVLYYGMAVKVRDRLNADNARYEASIGLQDDDSYIVWYRPIHH